MKKILAIITALMLFLLCFGGCTQSTTTPANSSSSDSTASNSSGTATTSTTTGAAAKTEEPVELKMWTFLNPNGGTSPRELALAQIIQNFQDQNPNITINTEAISFDLIPSQYFSAHVAGNAPDVIWMSFAEVGEAVRLGTMANLNELFLKNWTDAQKNEINDAFWSFAATDTDRYQMTFIRSSDCLIYRTDLFEEAGYSAPFKSWDEFIEACQAVTKDTDGDGQIDVWGFGQQFGSEKPISNAFLSSMIELQGGIFDDSGTPNWNSEAGVKSMNLVTDMVTKYKITPDTSVAYSQEDLIDGFCAGKYAVITAAASRYASCVANATFDPSAVKLAHFPSWAGNDYGYDILSGWCVGINSKSEKEDAAGKFIDYLFSPESEKIWVEVGGQPAMRESTAAEMADIFQKEGNEYLTVMMESFAKYGYCRPWQFVISGYDKLQNEAAQRILMDGMSVQESLDKSCQEFINQNS